MILRLLICSSLLASVSSATEVAGQVSLQDSKVAAVRKNQDFSGVVISFHPVDSREAIGPSPKHARMLQKNKTFLPHILAIQVGTDVDFPNADPIFHNAFSSYSGQIFDVGLYPPGSNRAVRFSRPGIVRVFCNIHSTMSAIILVVNTPYFVKTAMNGSFELNVPPGEYDLSVFHERASEQELSGLTRRVLVPDSGLQIPPIMISEAGYLVAPHKNKYGHEYPPTHDDDQVFYPGVRN
jgi:plastocyanin